MPNPVAIAYFVTPHGFGHATRAAAVMAAIGARLPAARFEIFSTCPRWIFEDSLAAPFGYHPTGTDVGMVQTSPLAEDPQATCEALSRLLPFGENLLERLSRQLVELGCSLVICDIAALGIAAARRAGLPSILVESFTWDWIYHTYAGHAPGLQRYADELAEIYAQVDAHVQTEPLCRSAARAALTVAPIARTPRRSPDQIRRRIGLKPHEKMVLITMGGVPDRFAFLEHLPDEVAAHLVIPGAKRLSRPHRAVTVLPVHSDFYHPDLVQAADLLIAKAGYSTVAEAHQAGTPIAYLTRPRFPESPILERFIQRHLPSRCIAGEDYATGRWLLHLPELLALARHPAAAHNGADAVADFVCRGLLNRQH